MNPAEIAKLPELCHSLMERSPVPMAELEGAKHFVRYVNPSFCRLVGKSKETLVSRPFAETVQQGDRCLAVLDRVYRSGEPEAHTEAEHPEPHPVYWSYAAWPVLDAQQRPVGVMMQVTETTLFHQQTGAMNQALLLSSVRQHEHTEAAEKLNHRLQAEIDTRCRLEKQLKEQAEALRQADRRKDRFLAVLAHELRNPLAPALNAVQILKLHGPDQSELTAAQDIIERQVRQLARLVDDLLDVTRISSGKIRLQRESLKLAAVVACAVETSRPLIETRRHQLTIDLPPEPLWLDGDLTRLAQVVANLLNNAAKYTPEGGRIELTVERDGGEVVLRVRDNGVGLDAEMLLRVFDLFAQADQSLARAQGGLGIGLNLVRHLIEMHGGRVQAASAGAGQGSEFIVRLPLVPEPRLSQEAPQADKSQRPPALARRILVVDDNIEAADTLAMLLRHLGHEVQAAHSGPEALAAAQTSSPEIVLLDIGLPEMDGYEVARRLRQQPVMHGALLVALTGYGQEDDRRRTQAAGFDHHLVKPVGLGALQNLLDSLGADLASARR